MYDEAEANGFDSEAAYNEEVTRLINEGLRCPLCNRPPIEVQIVEYMAASSAECEAGHIYLVTNEEQM